MTILCNGNCKRYFDTKALSCNVGILLSEGYKICRKCRIMIKVIPDLYYCPCCHAKLGIKVRNRNYKYKDGIYHNKNEPRTHTINIKREVRQISLETLIKIFNYDYNH